MILLGGGLIAIAFFTTHTWRIPNPSVKERDAALSSKIGDLVETDTNGNGIPDWQESLWGLDPSKNGAENKKFIDDKKASLGIVASSSAEAPLSDTERFSREFFSVILSLRESGTLDEKSLGAVAENITKSLSASAKEKYAGRYTIDSIKISDDNSAANLKKYQSSLVALIKTYTDEGVGTEMKSVSDALAYSDPRPLEGLSLIQKSYADFAKGLLAIRAPRSLSATHLSLVNSADIIARTIEPLTHLLEDPLTALPALVAYQREIDTFLNTINRLNAFYRKS